MTLGSTPIDSCNESECETTLCNAFAKGNLSVYERMTVFHHASSKENLKMIQFLLEQGYDMNAVDNEENTAFHFACFSGNLNVVQFLLQQGFNMNVADNHGRNVFHYACSNANFNVIQFFLQQEFDMNVLFE